MSHLDDFNTQHKVEKRIADERIQTYTEMMEEIDAILKKERKRDILFIITGILIILSSVLL